MITTQCIRHLAENLKYIRYIKILNLGKLGKSIKY